MSNPTGKGGFKRGDPRINRNGRPKTFDALRALAQDIAHEVAKDQEGERIAVDGHLVTVAENILRDWAGSSNPRLQQAFIEIAYGKPPQTTMVEHKGEPAGTFTVCWNIGDDAVEAI